MHQGDDKLWDIRATRMEHLLGSGHNCIYKEEAFLCWEKAQTPQQQYGKDNTHFGEVSRVWCLWFRESSTKPEYQWTGKALEGTITELDQHMEDTLEQEGELQSLWLSSIAFSEEISVLEAVRGSIRRSGTAGHRTITNKAS